MKDKTVIGGIGVTLVGTLLIGAAWFFFLRPSALPTTPIETIPILLEDDTNYTIYEIIPAKSEVTFALDEVLRGLPITVVGRSRQVAGQIAINFADLPASQIGPIRINARTLFTDNEFRNNAIQNFILETETHEYITFIPNKISGWPGDFHPGEPVLLQIAGELTIRESTNSVIFSTSVTINDASELVGSGSSQINRADFQLRIPDAPGVAAVDETVNLSITFVAEPVAMRR